MIEFLHNLLNACGEGVDFISLVARCMKRFPNNLRLISR